MSDPLSGARRFASRIVAAQALVTVLLVLVALVAAGAKAGWSAGLGGGIGTGATLYMAVRAFDGTAGADGREMLRRFFRAELLKVGLTICLFVLVFRFVPVLPLWLLGAYAATYAAYGAALIGDASGPTA